MVWVLGHIRIDGNETTDELARLGSSHPLSRPELVFGISAKVARGMIKDWTS